MSIIKNWLKKTQFYILVILILYCAVVSLRNPQFFSIQNLFDILRSSSVTMIFAMGVMIVLVSGGIDVSFAVVGVFSAYASIMFIIRTGFDNIVIAFVIAIAVGALLGFLNACLIHFFRLSTFLVTLGTQNMLIGLMAVLLGTKVINTPQMPKCFVDFGTAKLLTIYQANGQQYGLSIIIIPVVIITFLCWFILYWTAIGRGTIAIGNSMEAAKRAGYNITKIHFFIYITVGIIAAVAGVIYVSDVAWASPLTNNLVGGTELLTIAAVVIGGTKLTGGEVSLFGTVLGVLLIRLFATTLIFLGITTSWNQLFTGIVLLGCNVVISYNRRKTRKKLLIFEE
jgi:simple sugar transport system permease protein